MAAAVAAEGSMLLTSSQLLLLLQVAIWIKMQNVIQEQLRGYSS
jgi:hypothetical protein